MIPSWLTYIFVVVALVASGAYGAFASDVFGVDTDKKSRAWRAHQFWFNFLGSVAGWVALWLLLPAIARCIGTSCTPSLSVSSGLLAVVAFVGVTGHLPYATAGVLQAVKELALKVAGLGR